MEREIETEANLPPGEIAELLPFATKMSLCPKVHKLSLEQAIEMLPNLRTRRIEDTSVFALQLQLEFGQTDSQSPEQSTSIVIPCHLKRQLKRPAEEQQSLDSAS